LGDAVPGTFYRVDGGGALRTVAGAADRERGLADVMGKGIVKAAGMRIFAQGHTVIGCIFDAHFSISLSKPFMPFLLARGRAWVLVLVLTFLFLFILCIST
jgi:hypothetical protein